MSRSFKLCFKAKENSEIISVAVPNLSAWLFTFQSLEYQTIGLESIRLTSAWFARYTFLTSQNWPFAVTSIIRRFRMQDPDGAVRPLFTSSYNDDSPSWSPGGQRIAFASDRAGRDGQFGEQRYAVYTYNLSSARIERVTPDGLDARDPAWRPR